MPVLPGVARCMLVRRPIEARPTASGRSAAAVSALTALVARGLDLLRHYGSLEPGTLEPAQLTRDDTPLP